MTNFQKNKLSENVFSECYNYFEHIYILHDIISLLCY